jgi:hypothetical protein
MRKTVLLVALLSLLALGGQSFAELCTVDAVPAATLLLPYFEVSLDDTSDVNTLFSVNNASAAPTVAHVTLWGDWSLPSIDFDIFLTGYDVQTVSLDAVFNGGFLPITAHSTNDQGMFDPNGDPDTISPHGDNPEWDSSPDNLLNPLFPGCDNNLPLDGGQGGPVLDQDLLDRIRNGHTGVADASFGGGCIGQAYGDNIARGYVTVDNVIDCNLLFPNQDGYFGTGGFVSDVNQLWGDYFIINATDGFAYGDNLVHVEADAQAFGPGDYTFYGRYVDGLATDNREPLGTTWATRYLNGGGFDGGTDLVVWRDSKFDSTAEAFTCGAGPDWFPLNETQVVAFDEEESATEICLPEPGGIGGVSPPPDPGVDPTCFPLETGRYAVNEGELLVPYDFGWMYLNLNFTLSTGGQNDGLFGDIAQSYVTTNLDSFDLNLSVGFPAIELTNACSDANPVIVGNL